MFCRLHKSLKIFTGEFPCYVYFNFPVRGFSEVLETSRKGKISIEGIMQNNILMKTKL